MRNFLLSLLAVLFIYSCASHPIASSIALPIDGIDCPKAESQSALKEVCFVQLSDTLPINQVKRVIVVGDTLIVHTDSGIYCYNNDGNFFHEISRRGRAANEWTVINAVYKSDDGNSLKVIDANKMKTMTFSFDGKFLGDEDIPERLLTVFQAGYLDGGKTAYAHGLLGDSAILYSIEKPGGMKASVYAAMIPRIVKMPLS